MKLDLTKVKKRVHQKTVDSGKISSRVGRKPKPNLTTWNLKFRISTKNRTMEYLKSDLCEYRDASTLINDLLDKFLDNLSA